MMEIFESIIFAGFMHHLEAGCLRACLAFFVSNYEKSEIFFDKISVF